MESQRLVIVLVEDDDGLRSALAGFLSASGYEARPYATAESVLEDPTWRRAACLVVDVGLPGMSGLEFLRRRDARDMGVPVVVVSGRDDPKTRSAAAGCGIAEFIAKPVDGRTVVAAVGRAIGSIPTQPKGGAA